MKRCANPSYLRPCSSVTWNITQLVVIFMAQDMEHVCVGVSFIVHNLNGFLMVFNLPDYLIALGLHYCLLCSHWYITTHFHRLAEDLV